MEVKKGNSATLFMASQAETVAQNCDPDFLFLTKTIVRLRVSEDKTSKNREEQKLSFTL